MGYGTCDCECDVVWCDVKCGGVEWCAVMALRYEVVCGVKCGGVVWNVYVCWCGVGRCIEGWCGVTRNGVRCGVTR